MRLILALTVLALSTSSAWPGERTPAPRTAAQQSQDPSAQERHHHRQTPCETHAPCETIRAFAPGEVGRTVAS